MISVTININTTQVTVTPKLISDGTFTVGSISHTLIQDIGTNSHAAIDTFISSTGLQEITEINNTTDQGLNVTNSNIVVTGTNTKVSAPEFETSGGSIQLSQRITQKAFGTFEEIRDNIVDTRALQIKVPVTSAGTSTPKIPVVGAEFTLTPQSVFTDVFTGILFSPDDFIGTGGFITNQFSFRFQNVGKIIKLRVKADTGSGVFDLFGTSEDPFLRFTTSAGITVIDLSSPIPTNLGVNYITTFETEDASALNILGDNSGPTFDHFRSFLAQPFSEETYDAFLQDGAVLDLGPQLSAPAHKEGRIWYDAVRDTLNFYNAVSDMTVNLPEESIQPVINNTGVTITNGQIVRVSGASGGLPEVILALADTVSNARIAGIATHDIEDGTKGYITIIGSVSGINTSAFTEGDTLFLSDTVAGAFTNVEQQILHPTGICLISDASNGVVLVSSRGIVNITALGQTRGLSKTQAITTTPTECYCFDLAELELNVTVDQVQNPAGGEDGFDAAMSPESIGASGFYGFNFGVTITGTGNVNHRFELYIDTGGGFSPTGVVADVDLSNNNTNAGNASLSGLTESIVTNNDSMKIFVYTTSSTSTVTYTSSLFGVERKGNA